MIILQELVLTWCDAAAATATPYSAVADSMIKLHLDAMLSLPTSRTAGMSSLCCCCCCCEQIPADPKLLVSRFEPEKLSQFFLTNIEQQPRRELLLPADVGVPIRYSMLVMTAAAAAATAS
jgi:hypothetical protein